MRYIYEEYFVLIGMMSFFLKLLSESCIEEKFR